MSKKTASMKPKKKSISEERTPEEYFIEAKAGLIAIVESSLRNATRPDMVVKQFADNRDLFNNNYIEMTYQMINVRKDTYKKVLDVLNAITFEKITADEYDDPFSDLLEYIDTDKKITSANETVLIDSMMMKFAKFDTVRPFGEKLEQLRMALIKDQDK